MRKGVKDTIIVEIGEKPKEFPHFYLVDLTGLNAGIISAPRRKYFRHEAKMVAVKNMLLRKAFDASDVGYELLYDSLKGSTTVMFTQIANVPVKLLEEYQKEGIPALKAAYAEESIYVGADRLAELTALESKSEVIAKIVILLQSPIKNAASVLRPSTNAIHGVSKISSECLE